MNIKLLKKLRKEAYNQIKIKYTINDTYCIINKYFDSRYYFDTDVDTIEEAIKRLIIARRYFIENNVKILRLNKLRKLSKIKTKKLNNL